MSIEKRNKRSKYALKLLKKERGLYFIHSSSWDLGKICVVAYLAWKKSELVSVSFSVRQFIVHINCFIIDDGITFTVLQCVVWIAY
uniref:Uncharacterized protein n=1 Tax=Heterorhabditis bacteriophora TaxID=37862 RepID=A0A1I7WT94_HETBA